MVSSAHIAHKTVKLSAKRLVQSRWTFIQVKQQQQQHFSKCFWWPEWGTIICRHALLVIEAECLQWWMTLKKGKKGILCRTQTGPEIGCGRLPQGEPTRTNYFTVVHVVVDNVEVVVFLVF